MKNQNSEITKLARAKSRVNALKGFYQHLTVYIIVNAVLLLFSGSIRFVLLSEEALGNPDFLEWINWNVLGTPIIWGIALGIHALSVFCNTPFRKWEERQIQKILKEDR